MHTEGCIYLWLWVIEFIGHCWREETSYFVYCLLRVNIVPRCQHSISGWIELLKIKEKSKRVRETCTLNQVFIFTMMSLPTCCWTKRMQQAQAVCNFQMCTPHLIFSRLVLGDSYWPNKQVKLLHNISPSGILTTTINRLVLREVLSQIWFNSAFPLPKLNTAQTPLSYCRGDNRYHAKIFGKNDFIY